MLVFLWHQYKNTCSAWAEFTSLLPTTRLTCAPVKSCHGLPTAQPGSIRGASPQLPWPPTHTSAAPPPPPRHPCNANPRSMPSTTAAPERRSPETTSSGYGWQCPAARPDCSPPEATGHHHGLPTPATSTRTTVQTVHPLAAMRGVSEDVGGELRKGGRMHAGGKDRCLGCRTLRSVAAGYEVYEVYKGYEGYEGYGQPSHVHVSEQGGRQFPEALPLPATADVSVPALHTESDCMRDGMSWSSLRWCAVADEASRLALSTSVARDGGGFVLTSRCLLSTQPQQPFPDFRLIWAWQVWQSRPAEMDTVEKWFTV